MIHIDKQSINESLLQSYRSIFISSQSFQLAIGALFYGKSIFILLFLAGLSLIQIWWIWFRVVFSRAMVVDYYKYNMESRFDHLGNEIADSQSGNNISELSYVQSRDIRVKINKALGIKTLRVTRVKIDLVLPLIFSLLWGLMVISIFFTNS